MNIIIINFFFCLFIRAHLCVSLNGCFTVFNGTLMWCNCNSIDVSNESAEIDWAISDRKKIWLLGSIGNEKKNNNNNTRMWVKFEGAIIQNASSNQEIDCCSFGFFFFGGEPWRIVSDCNFCYNIIIITDTATANSWQPNSIKNKHIILKNICDLVRLEALDVNNFCFN